MDARTVFRVILTKFIGCWK